MMSRKRDRAQHRASSPHDVTTKGGVDAGVDEPTGKGERGFTLIELVMVILILGVLSGTATMRYRDLVGIAQERALLGIAGGLSSSAVVNISNCALNKPDCVRISNCTDAGDLLEGGLPKGYEIVSAPLASGKMERCSLLQIDSGNTAIVFVTGNSGG